jgi:uroporphyrin-III C-methyltransferase
MRPKNINKSCDRAQPVAHPFRGEGFQKFHHPTPGQSGGRDFSRAVDPSNNEALAPEVSQHTHPVTPNGVRRVRNLSSINASSQHSQEKENLSSRPEWPDAFSSAPHSGASGHVAEGSWQHPSPLQTTGTTTKRNTLPTHPASVHLVGAGPGDPELLTRKALRLLESADVVLHDALVSPEILQLIPAHTEIIDVGKRAGTKFLTQQDINALLVAAAQNSKNKIVVRLKGGDPSLFGRATEEIDSLRAANIPFEIVPGISAAFAAAAAAKISFTDRRIASHVLFTTFSRSPEAQLLPLIGLTPDTTVAIYMPGSDYAHVSRYLIDSGFTPETPCVVVSRASHKDQTEHRTTVAALAEQKSLPAPSLLLAGRVIAHHTADDTQTVANEILTWHSDATVEPPQISARQGKPQ